MQPLSGVRILDLTRLLPGPWATMMLADLGAEVIKIEHPAGGDGSRAAHPRHEGEGTSESAYFYSVNRNKRSVTLDLKHPADRERFLAMVPEATAVIESFKAGGADALGIGYAKLRELNPTLVYCALTGFGQTGPLAPLPGHDLLVSSMSGFVEAGSDGRPRLPRYLMGDYSGGTMTLIAVLAALYERKAHGRGAYLDVSMFDGLAAQSGVQLLDAFVRDAGGVAERTIEGWGGNPRYDFYRTRDGRFIAACLLEKRYWDAFCRHVGREDMINPNETEADRLSTHGARGEAYRRFLTETFASDDCDDWVRRLHREGIPVGPVLTLEEMYRSRFNDGRARFLRAHDPRFGRAMPQPGFPFGMTLSDGTDGFALRHPAPVLGEGNAELLPQGRP